jgi:hypothetical protein
MCYISTCKQDRQSNALTLNMDEENQGNKKKEGEKMSNEIKQLEKELEEVKSFNADKKEWERKATQGLEFKIKMKKKKYK